MYTFWGTAAMCMIGMVGLLVDDRTILGEPAWLKPVKFGLSIPVYCLTMAWLLSIYPIGEKTKNFLDILLGWTLILEIPLVMIQAARGVRSHFNIDTPFDSMIFSAMGMLILLNSLGVVFLMLVSWSKRLNTTLVMQRAIQIAWLAMIVSMHAGVIMSSSFAHSVGVSDGGEGIPLTHWNKVGGDWRAVHFFGMHAIQILPLLAYFLHKKNVKEKTAHWVIWGTGILYLAFVGNLYFKTKAGLSIIAFLNS